MVPLKFILLSEVLDFLRSNFNTITDGSDEKIYGQFAFHRKVDWPPGEYESYIPPQLNEKDLRHMGWRFGNITMPGEGITDKIIEGYSLFLSNEHWFDMSVDDRHVTILEKKIMNPHAQIWTIRFDGNCDNMRDFHVLCTQLNIP